MGNFQDEFQNVDEYETDNDKSDVLIDRSHKRIFATKYQKNIGYLMNKQHEQNFDSQVLHKSMALQNSKFVQKPVMKKRKIQIEPPKLQKLDLKFYHSLGLPEYTYLPKSVQMDKTSARDKDLYIHEAEDRAGVIYVGQRNSKGNFHGNGILKANTVHYIGQFFHGTKHFHGRQIYSNEVYEGQFSYDFRKGMGIKYTPQFIDEGFFDKLILYGTRTFKNGNIYVGTFQNNIMHTNFDFRSETETSFYDYQNNLYYEESVEFKNGSLVKANKVFKISNTTGQKQLIGKFADQQIIKIDSSDRMQRDSRAYTNVSKISQQQRIRRKIQEWE